MRVVFMGTPDFSVPMLAALAARPDLAEVVAAVTQPDRPRGRGQKMAASPVKAWAEAHDIPVLQPVRVRDASFVAEMRALRPDVAVVAAFGQILSQELLDIPTYGCINVHASLLPRWRGAAPIQHAVMNGDTVSGITTMQMDAGLDTGDMLLRREVAITPETTYGMLHDVLMETGAALLIETFERLADGTLKRMPQTGESSYAPRITRETALIDWTRPARTLDAFVRGLNPMPYAVTTLGESAYQIGRLRLTGRPASASAGAIVCADPKDGLIVAAGDEDVEITEMQAPGKKMMEAAAYLRGHRLATDTRFGI
ncbi:methionyl-tRNA formyltransferase [Selenomonas sp. F0473]|uniref:methionyl-tRNA formyltransferase n=1 Tax=Selenomonas sp. F0473 TaxID=999423 RepID=UPI00029E1FEB|nr:methionyl-tRNA formyltransferase [Selenomonas sp. F0473]EKU71851.1 methionyl-tRNA formyltransferase [Selenomonas sp. F0473]